MAGAAIIGSQRPRPADTIKVAGDQAARSAASWSKGSISRGRWRCERWMRFGEAPTFCKPWMISITVITENVEAALGLPIRGRVAGHGLVDGFQDFGIDVGVERALFNGTQPPGPILSNLHGVLNGLVEQIGIVSQVAIDPDRSYLRPLPFEASGLARGAAGGRPRPSHHRRKRNGRSGR